MKILRIITSMNPAGGGPCQGIRNSVPELEKLGVQNEVVSLDDPSASYLGKDLFPVHAIGPGKGPWCYSPKLIPWLLENLVRFDVVIIHGLWLYHSYGALKALLQFKQENFRSPRVFVMPHGMLDPYFQRAPDRRFKALRNSMYWKLIEEKVVNGADGLLFTCETELRLAREPFRPYQPRREINVGYGIAKPPAFSPEMTWAFLHTCPELPSKPYLLFLGRIHEKKGVDLLIQAYAALHEEHGEEKFKMPALVIAGPGQETSYGKEIQRMAHKTALLRSSIIFSGMLTGDAKWGAFYGCDAFILPSHQENFGIAVVEALACGKPVLISDKVNIWREIEEVGGALVAPDSPEGTRQVLKAWICKTSEEKNFLSRAALETFEKKFSSGPAAQQLVDGVNS